MPSNRRRIAIVFEFRTLNGGEHSMLASIDRLGGSRYEIVALTGRHGPLADSLRQRGIEIIPFDIRDGFGERIPQRQACESLQTAVAGVAPDLLHANSLSMGRLTGQIAGITAIPCVAHLRDIVRLNRTSVGHLNRNRSLIAVSHATKEFDVQQGLDAERCRVIHNGVDCERFQPRPATGDLRRDLAIPQDAFLVATIGQICLRKAHDVLADAAARLRHRIPNAAYLIVGERHSAKRESVELESDMIRKFAQAGLSDRLYRPGYRRDVDRILNDVDLLVHPARQEPLGRVLLEASASGTPIVATNVGGTPEIVRDDETGRLVPPDDPAAMADAIIEMHHDADKRARFAQAARQAVLAHFTAERATSELTDAWEDACSS